MISYSYQIGTNFFLSPTLLQSLSLQSRRDHKKNKNHVSPTNCDRVLFQNHSVGFTRMKLAAMFYKTPHYSSQKILEKRPLKWHRMGKKCTGGNEGWGISIATTNWLCTWGSHLISHHCPQLFPRTPQRTQGHICSHQSLGTIGKHHVRCCWTLSVKGISQGRPGLHSSTPAALLYDPIFTLLFQNGFCYFMRV